MSKMNDIRMTSAQHQELGETMRKSPKETAIFLVAGVFETKNGIHFTVIRILTPKEQDYDSRNEYHIQVSPLFFNKAISLAETNNVTVIQCHSHPDADYLQYSPTDNRGESISAKTIQNNLGLPMGSLLFGREKNHWTCMAITKKTSTRKRSPRFIKEELNCTCY